MDAEAPGPLAPGLYVVSTPIGAARDITLRALDILASADVLAAEDTRTLRRLMEIHGIRRLGRRIVAYHDHSAPGALRGLLDALAAGRSVALVSEAGTPLVADPGFRLVRESVAAGYPVLAAPGASALLAGLAVSGLPTDRFLFAGFLPAKAVARARALVELAPIAATLVVYESPRRLADTLVAMAENLGPDRAAVVARELTKRFEEVRRGPLRVLAAAYAQEPAPKGEVVVMVGPPEKRESDEAALDMALADALARGPLSDAAAEVARALGLPRRQVYARALELRDASQAGRKGPQKR
jgi:16S rRNA (cytidine1402-2'-O)-methyltransferase